MKYIGIFILVILTTSTVLAATYTGTKPKDLDTTTPTESNTKVSEFNNSDREIKTVITNLEGITAVTGTYTVGGTQTTIIGSSSAGFTISFPEASTLATSAIKKKYEIKNINTGTITLNLTVDGVGSPTVTGSQTIHIYTDGTSWYESGARTAQTSSNADYLDNLDSTYYTNATNLATGTVALARIPSTLTGKDADTVDGYHAGTSASMVLVLDGSALVPLANIPSTLTGKDADSIDSIDGTNIVQTSRTISTTAPLAGGGALSGNLTLSMPLGTSGQDGYISSADWNTFNNKVSTSVTISTTAPLAGGGDLSSNRTLSIPEATISQDGYIKKEDFQTFTNKANIVAGSGITSSSTTGTTTITNNGVLQIIAGSGISANNNGTGSVTLTAVGTTTAGGWLDTGTASVGSAGYQIIPHGTITIDTAYGITGILDRDVPNTITLDNFTQITTRNYDDISGTSTIKPTQIAIGTTTLNGALNAIGSATFSGTVTATGFVGNGSQLTGITSSFSTITGSASAAQLPSILELPATTTAITGTSASGRWYNLQQSGGSSGDSYTKLLLHMDNPGTSTFVDFSALGHTVTANGSAIGTSTAVAFGSGTFYGNGTNAYLNIPEHADLEPLAADFTVDACVTPRTGASGQNPFSKPNGAVGNIASYNIYINSGNYLLYMSSDGSSWDVVNGGLLGSATAGVKAHLAITRNGNTIRWFRDGVQTGTATSAASLVDGAYGTYIGAIRDNVGDTAYFDGYIDEFRFTKGIARWTSNFTPPTAAYGETYIYYSATYISPGTTTPNLILQDAGTTTEASYMMANVDTLIVGAGTTTAVTGTTTAYSGWYAGAVRATAFNVASTEKIKENIKPIKIKPDLLDAEADAKKKYMADNFDGWLASNQAQYEQMITEGGTGTVIYVDKVGLAKAYSDYIELQWASDPARNTYIDNIQKGYEKVFWQTFDSMAPKSWNPKEKPNITRRGFVVEEMPDVVKGDDMQSIDGMSLIAYMTRAEQSLKADTVFALSMLKELITTGTVTQQKIDHCNDRLEVLNP